MNQPVMVEGTISEKNKSFSRLISQFEKTLEQIEINNDRLFIIETQITGNQNLTGIRAEKQESPISFYDSLQQKLDRLDDLVLGASNCLERLNNVVNG